MDDKAEREAAGRAVMSPRELARIVAERYIGQGEGVTIPGLIESMPWADKPDLVLAAIEAGDLGLIQQHGKALLPTIRTLALMVQYERVAQRKPVYDAAAAYPSRPAATPTDTPEQRNG